MEKIIWIVAASLLLLLGCQETDPQTASDHGQNDSTGLDGKPEIDSDEKLIDTSEQDQSEHNEGDNTEQDEIEGQDNDSASEQNGVYSSDQAIVFVQEYLGTNVGPEMNFNYDGDDENGHYRIQVFEVIDHSGEASHTATYGWYLVDPKTGEVTDMLE